MLRQFNDLSKQLVLLHNKSLDTNADTLLERSFAVPSHLEGLEDHGVGSGHLPLFLSTMLDKELEDELPPAAVLEQQQQEAMADGHSAVTEESIKQHNQTLDDAHEFLRTMALRKELPGAASIFDNHSASRFAKSREKPLASAGPLSSQEAAEKRQRTA